MYENIRVPPSPPPLPGYKLCKHLFLIFRYIEVFRSSRVNVELALAYAGPESYNVGGFNEGKYEP